MAALIYILFILSLLGLIVGLVRPSIAIWWGERPKTRQRVVRTYGLAALGLLLLILVLEPGRKQPRPVVVQVPPAALPGSQGGEEARATAGPAGDPMARTACAELVVLLGTIEKLGPEARAEAMRRIFGLAVAARDSGFRQAAEQAMAAAARDNGVGATAEMVGACVEGGYVSAQDARAVTSP